MTDRQQQKEDVKLEEFKERSNDEQLQELYREQRIQRHRFQKLSTAMNEMRLQVVTSLATVNTAIAVLTTKTETISDNAKQGRQESRQDWHATIGWGLAIASLGVALFVALSRH